MAIIGLPLAAGRSRGDSARRFFHGWQSNTADRFAVIDQRS